ncbi:MAG: ABC transporter [Alphaproteobacteria bacterium]|nr:MAG: ABC transporter [Alphaproteobacteria bacterium]TMK49608.1 MAG: ABC transporter [Alphaproteobacteria bacterium]
MRGLDPRIHQSTRSLLARQMDGRVEPGHDGFCAIRPLDCDPRRLKSM